MKASDILYTSWEEIPLRKIRIILQILPQIRWDVHSSASNTYLKLFLLKHLFRQRKIFLLTSPEQRVDLFSEISWIKDFPHHFPLKSIQLNGILFRAPESAMADITIERLMEADIALYRYIRTENKNYLGHFLASLYTVPDTHWEDQLSHHSIILRQLQPFEAIAIIRSYIGSFNRLKESCPTLFPSFDSANSSPEGEAKRGDPATAWKSLLFELANSPGYPGMQAAKAALAWEALPYMDHEQQKIQRERERLKNSAPKV